MRIRSSVKPEEVINAGVVHLIQDHSNHGTSKEPMNPLWSRIHRFLWWVILDHWSDTEPDHPGGMHSKLDMIFIAPSWHIRLNSKLLWIKNILISELFQNDYIAIIMWFPCTSFLQTHASKMTSVAAFNFQIPPVLCRRETFDAFSKPTRCFQIPPA